MEVKINREIRNYTESMFFGLSLRQFIFSVLACGVALGLYFLLKPHFGTETVSWVCILGAAPFAALGFVKYNGMTAEKFIWAWIKSEFLIPKKLVFHSTNTYYELIKPTIEQKQKYANIFLHDIQRGDVAITEGKTLRDYITEYLSKAKDDQIHRVAVALGVDEVKLRTIMSLRLNSTNINEFGRYDDLKKTVNKAKAKEYFEKIEGTKIIPPKVNVKVDNLLREFILGGGFEIEMPE